MESFAFAPSLFVVLLAGTAVSAQSGCEINACMANMPKGNSDQNNVGLYCNIMRETTNCLSRLMDTCSNNNVRSQVQQTLDAFQQKQRQCQNYKNVECDTEGYNRCREMIPRQSYVDHAEECRAWENVFDCLRRVRCNMEQFKNQVAQIDKRLNDKGCPRTAGSAFPCPSILCMTLAILLAFLILGQKW